MLIIRKIKLSTSVGIKLLAKIFLKRHIDISIGFYEEDFRSIYLGTKRELSTVTIYFPTMKSSSQGINH